MLDNIINAAKELESEGVRAICGACGYLGYFQKAVAEATDVPVFLSSLIQIPFIKMGLKSSQKIGIICAYKSYLTTEILNTCGIKDPDICIVRGLEEFENLSAILNNKGCFNNDKIRDEVVSVVREMVDDNPEIGAILLKCSDLPPYAFEVQKAVKLPVFHFITMIDMVYHSVAQKPFYGFI